jgi:putative transposase
MHGGADGSGAPSGSKNGNYKHGRYTAEVAATHRWLREAALADLGVTKSHSRPHTSNDNPFSESHFKTMKYQPQFPQRFGCIQDAKTFCRSFFDWYNQNHHHAGIGLMTPDQVHYGQADQIHAARQTTLDGAFSRNPERFVRKEPEPPAKPIATWINPPIRQPTVQA